LQNPRILIDESLPIDLADELAPLTVATVRKLGWTDLRNGELLRRAETAGFTVLLTADQNLQYQQSIPHFELAVLVLLGPNRIENLRTLVPSILAALPLLSPGTVMRLGA
jgi:predicted nuclease of predicted toxin-antitoxin system